MSEAIKKDNRNYDADPDSIFNVAGLSIRTLNALTSACITTVSTLRETTDRNLLRVRNFGEKCLAEIHAALPDRAKTYEGEAGHIKARRLCHDLDVAARRQFNEQGNMKLSEFTADDSRVKGRPRARQILTEYCVIFPERIDDVLSRFEAAQDTSDKLYIMLKLSRGRKRAISQGTVEI